MQSSKSLVILKLSLTPSTIGLLHTLHTELNTFLPPNPSNISSSSKEILEVAWDIHSQITQDELSVLITEWSKAKGSLPSPSRFFDLAQRNVFSIDQIVVALRNIAAGLNEFPNYLSRSIDVLASEYDLFLRQASDIGSDVKGNIVSKLDPASLALMNEIFRIFDQKEQGHLTIDTLFFLFIALLEEDKKALLDEFSEEDTFCSEVNRRFKKFLTDIKWFQGRVSARQVIAYLLYNGKVSKNDLNSIRKSARNTTEMAEELMRNIFQDSDHLIPDLLDLSIKRTFPQIHLQDTSKQSTDIQLFNQFLLLQFYAYIDEQEYFEGIFISNKTLLAQMLFKEFKKYYGEEALRSITWSFDPAHAFLSIITTYNDLASQIIHFYFQHTKKDLVFSKVLPRPLHFEEGSTIQSHLNKPSISIFSGSGADIPISFRDPFHYGEKQGAETPENLLSALNSSVKNSTGKFSRANSVKKNDDKENRFGLKPTGEQRNKGYMKPTISRDSKSKDTAVRRDGNSAQQKFGKQRVRNNSQEPNLTTKNLRKALEDVSNARRRESLFDFRQTPKEMEEDRLEMTGLSGLQYNIPSERTEEVILSVPSHRIKPDEALRENYGRAQKMGLAKPPLKGHETPVIGKQVAEAQARHYESFSPYAFEQKGKVTEAEDKKSSVRKEPKGQTEHDIGDNAGKALAIAKGISVDDEIADEAFDSHDVERVRTQNKELWKHEKDILEDIVKRKLPKEALEEKAGHASKDSTNINELRKASITSHQALPEAKSTKNIDVMDILNKLDAKIFEGRHPLESKSGGNFSTNSSLKSDSKATQSNKTTIEDTVSHNEERRNLLEIIQEQIVKDKSQTLNTKSSENLDPNEGKKEYYLNLKDTISANKRENKANRAVEPKAPNTSSVHQTRQVQAKKKSIQYQEKFNASTPTKATKEMSIIKNFDQRRISQDLDAGKYNNIMLKRRQSGSKSPAHVRAARMAKVESFETVMQRLKKTPGNTPTKGKIKKRALH